MRKTISIKLSVLAAKRNHEEISGKGATYEKSSQK